MPPETAGFGHSKIFLKYFSQIYYLKLISEKFEIDRQDLKFLEKIGSGQFGVSLIEKIKINSNLNHFFLNTRLS